MSQILRKLAKFDLPQNLQHTSDCTKTRHDWLRPRNEHTNQNL